MKRGADARLWALVTATIRPLPGRRAPATPPPGPKRAPAPAPGPAATPRTAPAPVPPAPRPRRAEAPARIEPNRLRLIDLGREPLGGSIDLHGMTQDAARAALTAYLTRAFAENRRTVLVITGKGAMGDGVLRRRTPEWLAEPPLRAIVAGISEAHRRKGGEGALYVALKRNGRRG